MRGTSHLTDGTLSAGRPLNARYLAFNGHSALKQGCPANMWSTWDAAIAGLDMDDDEAGLTAWCEV
jgi:hypothetical protein